MDTRQFMHEIVRPGLKFLTEVAGTPSDDRAIVLVMTIAGQESDWAARRQIGIGQYHPQTVGARGYWQFESTWGGPVAINTVMQSTPRQLDAVCKHLEIPNDELTLYEAIAWNDQLACCMARLLLWQDPAALPEVGDIWAGWDYYKRNWEPGAPHPDQWPIRYDQAMTAMLTTPIA
jgi:hypothetical protein